MQFPSIFLPLVFKPVKRLAEKVREAFPNPVSGDTCHPIGENAYCVMGALRRYLGYKGGYFPEAEKAADNLTTANPNLSTDTAYQYASDILDANDAEEFSTAWELMDKALEKR